MASEMMLPRPAPRQLGLRKKPAPSSATEDRRGVREVAGRTAAECAAICCCCPCAAMKLVVLAVYKVPTGLCLKAWKKKQRKALMKKKKALSQQQQSSKTGTTSSLEESELDRLGSSITESADHGSPAVDLETEMWNQFRGTGFWRSPSQKNR